MRNWNRLTLLAGAAVALVAVTGVTHALAGDEPPAPPGLQLIVATGGEMTVAGMDGPQKRRRAPAPSVQQ